MKQANGGPKGRCWSVASRKRKPCSQGLQPAFGPMKMDTFCWCTRRRVESKPTGFCGGNWISLLLTSIHPSMHTSIHPYIHPYMHTYVLNVRKTHCERNSFKNRQNILTLFWKLFEIVGKLFSSKTILWKLFKHCFYQKDISKQFYENCFNIFLIQNMFRSILRKLFKHCFYQKSLKTILWKLFKHSFYQKDLWNNFMNIV